ncbi:MAG: hypothetical protein ACE5E4_04375 [Candidatus Binatia bacterium]
MKNNSILTVSFVAPRFAALVAVAALLMPAAPSLAALCGDSVGGSRVACACGDVVVSDTTLRPGDPVVSSRCEADGLLIRAGRGDESITLDMAGLSIVGTGSGVGIRVIDGGSLGAVIRGGYGQVVGFVTGIRASGRQSLQLAENVEVTGNRRDGLALRGTSARLVGVIATGNGRHGMWVRSIGGGVIDSNASDNLGSGLRLSGRGGNIEARLSGNGSHGVLATGRDHDLSGVEAVGNASRDTDLRSGRAGQ